MVEIIDLGSDDEDELSIVGELTARDKGSEFAKRMEEIINNHDVVQKGEIN